MPRIGGATREARSRIRKIEKHVTALREIVSDVKLEKGIPAEELTTYGNSLRQIEEGALELRRFLED